MATTMEIGSGCRWAAYQEEECPREFVDLPKSEQVARGRTLLSLLQAPMFGDASCEAQPKLSLSPPPEPDTYRIPFGAAATGIFSAAASGAQCPSPFYSTLPAHVRVAETTPSFSSGARVPALPADVPPPPSMPVPPPPPGFKPRGGALVRRAAAQAAADAAFAGGAAPSAPPRYPPPLSPECAPLQLEDCLLDSASSTRASQDDSEETDDMCRLLQNSLLGELHVETHQARARCVSLATEASVRSGPARPPGTWPQGKVAAKETATTLRAEAAAFVPSFLVGGWSTAAAMEQQPWQAAYAVGVPAG